MQILNYAQTNIDLQNYTFYSFKTTMNTTFCVNM